MLVANHAIVLNKLGGPEVLEWTEVELEPPGPREIQLRQTYIALNYADIYHRTGVYPLSLPEVLGVEAAGLVEAVGAEVRDFQIGDRVAYTLAIGAYAQRRNVPAERAVHLPDDIEDRTAAALLGKGLTARYLLRDLHVVRPGEAILVHAAAGGVGSLMCQWAAALGATVIGTVSSDAKAEFAQARGCHFPIVLGRGDLATEVMKITSGAKVAVAYDSIGQATFMASLDCLQPRGLLVYYGESSGAVGPVPLEILGPKGSLMVTRPTLAHFMATRQRLVEAASELFAAVRNKILQPAISQTYSLQEAAAAHRDLEARRTTGSTVFEV